MEHILPASKDLVSAATLSAMSGATEHQRLSPCFPGSRLRPRETYHVLRSLRGSGAEPVLAFFRSLLSFRAVLMVGLWGVSEQG